MGLVFRWLESIGLGYAVAAFKDLGVVTPLKLSKLELADYDLAGVHSINDRKKLFYLVQRIKLAVENPNSSNNSNKASDLSTSNSNPGKSDVVGSTATPGLGVGSSAFGNTSGSAGAGAVGLGLDKQESADEGGEKGIEEYHKRGLVIDLGLGSGSDSGSISGSGHNSPPPAPSLHPDTNLNNDTIKTANIGGIGNNYANSNARNYSNANNNSSNVATVSRSKAVPIVNAPNPNGTLPPPPVVTSQTKREKATSGPAAISLLTPSIPSAPASISTSNHTIKTCTSYINGNSSIPHENTNSTPHVIGSSNNITRGNSSASSSVSSIRVVVRKRPLTRKEVSRGEHDVIEVQGEQGVGGGVVVVHEPRTKVDLTKVIESHPFQFDDSFDETITNQYIYKTAVKPLVDSVFKGGKATCFAYGQTGSGKTFTMMGDSGSKQYGDNSGLYVLAGKDIFDQLGLTTYRHLEVYVSAYEIYGGKLFDLLNKRSLVRCLEDKRQRVQVLGLSEHRIRSTEELVNVMEAGAVHRSTGSTGANSSSSRSHAILAISLKDPSPLPPPSHGSSINGLGYPSSKQLSNLIKHHNNNRSNGKNISSREVGKLSFIDLAGSERGADTVHSDKITRLEGAEINTSLLALKEVIRALGNSSSSFPLQANNQNPNSSNTASSNSNSNLNPNPNPNQYIPFRGSKLTQVLKDSFVGGRTKTLMITCIAPNLSNCEHTLNSLRYADRVKERERDPHAGHTPINPNAATVSSQQIISGLTPYPNPITTLEGYKESARMEEDTEMNIKKVRTRDRDGYNYGDINTERDRATINEDDNDKDKTAYVEELRLLRKMKKDSRDKEGSMNTSKSNFKDTSERPPAEELPPSVMEEGITSESKSDKKILKYLAADPATTYHSSRDRDRTSTNQRNLSSSGRDKRSIPPPPPPPLPHPHMGLKMDKERHADEGMGKDMHMNTEIVLGNGGSHNRTNINSEIIDKHSSAGGVNSSAPALPAERGGTGVGIKLDDLVCSHRAAVEEMLIILREEVEVLHDTDKYRGQESLSQQDGEAESKSSDNNMQAETTMISKSHPQMESYLRIMEEILERKNTMICSLRSQVKEFVTSKASALDQAYA